MAGKFNASNIKIQIGVDPVSPATTISVWKGVSEENTVTFDIGVAKIDTTTKYNNRFASSLPGLIEGTISGEAAVNNATSSTMYSSGDVLTMILSGVTKTFRIGTANDDDPYEVFQGYFTKFTKKADKESMAIYTFEIAMTTAPVPFAS
ncbi:hypothetical protein GO755_30460 [Spirosoma sp. HMF4905]|uniref:Phage tail protein n=1 Tax=Spirosoma arboris TaxID=2682092 RepID=A0A7K1SKV4_9BACT|nr:hypothetical protein [Spirosoma arboris]MVM34394.1 hypothetical protein [Spirosoma arboris]